MICQGPCKENDGVLSSMYRTGNNSGCMFIFEKKSHSSIVGEIEDKHATNFQLVVIRRQGSDSEARKLMFSDQARRLMLSSTRVTRKVDDK